MAKKKVPYEYQGSGYVKRNIGQEYLAKNIKLAVKALKGKRFDSIAFCGTSGAVVAPAVAVAMKKHLILVRKEGETRHSSYMVEGNRLTRRYVIIDDFVSCGETKSYIIESVSEFAPNAECIGLLEYHHLSEEELKKHKRYPLHATPKRKFKEPLVTVTTPPPPPPPLVMFPPDGPDKIVRVRVLQDDTQKITVVNRKKNKKSS